MTHLRSMIRDAASGRRKGQIGSQSGHRLHLRSSLRFLATLAELVRDLPWFYLRLVCVLRRGVLELFSGTACNGYNAINAYALSLSH